MYLDHVPSDLRETHLLVHVYFSDSSVPELALVDKRVTVREFIEEIVEGFSKQEQLDTKDTYKLRVKGSDIDLIYSDQLGDISEMQFRDTPVELEFRRPTIPTIEFIGVVGNKEIKFRVSSVPTLMGRPVHEDPASIDQVGVNLESIDEGRSVSREQARLTQREGKFFVETMPGKRPITVNDIEILPGTVHQLTDGDMVTLGQISLRAIIQ